MTADDRVGRVRVGVSACLLGQAVRYDATHRRHDRMIERFGARAEWITVCPEMELGLGAPREMIQLVAGGGAVRLITVETLCDITESMRRWVDTRVARLLEDGLDGYVFKSRSPSCGMAEVKVHERAGPDTPFQRTGRGLFAAGLLAAAPALPVAHETDLYDDAAIDAFIARVDDYAAR